VGASILNDKNTRKIARATGLPVIRAWSHGGYKHGFVTAAHVHGMFNVKTGEFRVYAGRVTHYSSCREMFPDGAKAALTLAEAKAMLEARASPPFGD